MINTSKERFEFEELRNAARSILVLRKQLLAPIVGCSLGCLDLYVRPWVLTIHGQVGCLCWPPRCVGPKAARRTDVRTSVFVRVSSRQQQWV